MSWSLTPLEFGCGTDHCSIPVTNSCYHHSILIHGHLLYSRDLFPSKYGYSILHGQSVMPLSSLPPLHVLSGFALGTLAQLDLVYWPQPHLRQEHVHCVSVTSVCRLGAVIEHLLMVGWSADPAHSITHWAIYCSNQWYTSGVTQNVVCTHKRYLATHQKE